MEEVVDLFASAKPEGRVVQRAKDSGCVAFFQRGDAESVGFEQFLGRRTCLTNPSP